MIDFDCHAHIFERVAAIPNSRYVPSAPASLSNWLYLQEQNDLKGGVIVQASFMGTDNSELCAALAKLDCKRFAGVAVVPLDISEEELERLVQAEVRGIRWNLVRGAEVPDLSAKSVQEFFGRLRQNHLHLEIHLEGSRLGPILPQLTDSGIKIVVDHFGLPSDPNPNCDPFVKAVGELVDASSLYFKFSAPYRTPFDLRPHAQELLSVVPAEKVVWGSDWPHTQHEHSAEFANLSLQRHEWGVQSDFSGVKALYGLD